MNGFKSLLILLPFLFSSAYAADWRKESNKDVQLENLVKLVPGTSHWMAEAGNRYQNLYWAAKLGRWEFAQYQVEEIEKLIQTVQLARPKRAATAQEFLNNGIPAITKGVESKDWAKFEESFVKLHHACMECHGKNDHAFIVLPLKPASASSPVLNLPQASPNQ